MRAERVMAAQAYTIPKRKKWFPEAFASIKDFALGESANLDHKEILHNPCISLYCADLKKKQAGFVEIPAGIDITASPFLYLAQYEHAVRVITVSFREVIALAEGLPAPGQNLIFLYTMGRAGSTLLAKMFEGDENTIALSEPDVLVDFVVRLKTAPACRAETEKLFFACMKLLLAGGITKGRKNVVIKPRGVCIEMWQTAQKTCQQSKIVFLYRNAKPVVESFMRAFPAGRVLYPLMGTKPGKIIIKYAAALIMKRAKIFFPHVEKRHLAAIGTAGIPGLLLVTWLSIMKTYCALWRNTGAMALTYDDLIAHPAEMLSRVFSYCGLPEASVARGLEALKKDSQAGTRMSGPAGRKKQKGMKELNAAQMQLLFCGEDEVTGMDYQAPGTIRPESTLCQQDGRASARTNAGR